MIYPEILISIVIPIYNYAQYVPRLIHSISNQKMDKFEVIIVDDGSTDETMVALSNELKGTRFKYTVLQQENSGRGRAILTGVKASRGDYILFLDADDELLPNALDAFEKEIKLDSGTEAFFANHRTVYEKSNKISVSENPSLSSSRFQNFRDYLIHKKFSFAAGSYIVRKNLLSKYFFDLDLRISEDKPFESQLLANCNCKIIDEVVLTVYRHEGSMRSNWQYYYQQHMMLIERVFNQDKLLPQFLKLKNLYCFRVKRSVFKALYKAGEYHKAKEIFRDYFSFSTCFNLKILFRYFVCLFKTI